LPDFQGHLNENSFSPEGMMNKAPSRQQVGGISRTAVAPQRFPAPPANPAVHRAANNKKAGLRRPSAFHR